MKLGYVILYVPDVATTMAFYESAFGLTRRMLTPDGSYGELSTGGTTLSFASEPLAGSHGFDFTPQRPPARPAFEVALVDEDVEGAWQRALAAGAGALSAPKAKPWGQVVAYVSDNNGFTVELCSPMG